MPKAKTPRTIKPKAEKKLLQMPEAGNGNGSVSPNLELESQIRERAYQIYAERGYSNGSEREDWLEAEREIKARHANHSRSA